MDAVCNTALPCSHSSIKLKLRMLSFFCLLLGFLYSRSAVLCVDEYSRADFPPGFIFGSGSSAYQVEGAANEGGRTPSIWDTFAHQGKMDGATGDVTVDQYHRYKEDVKLMAETGLDTYRFSISWSRLIPNGRGLVNPEGLQYYNNLINELISHGIQPHVTIYHHDLPQILEDEYGGWISRKIVKDYTAYAEVCFKEFGDRVLHWTTLNEPNTLPLFAYDWGMLPPNRCSPPFGINCTKGNSSTEPYLVAYHTILAHASAVKLYREKYQGKQLGSIGINLLVFGCVPLTNSTADLLAAQRANDFLTGLITHPLVFGDYPETVKKAAGIRLPAFSNYETKLVKGSFDFFGLNHYFSAQIKDDSASLNKENRDFQADMGILIMSVFENSSLEYPINPTGMQEALEYFKQSYGNPPIYIHENGQRTRCNSTLEDTSRVKYMHTYIGSMLDAIRNGSNTRGYFLWSFLDMLELLGGYEKCFGLYYVNVDDPQLVRHPKLSAHWYSRFLKGERVDSNGIGSLQLQNNLSTGSATHTFQ